MIVILIKNQYLIFYKEDLFLTGTYVAIFELIYNTRE